MANSSFGYELYDDGYSATSRQKQDRTSNQTTELSPKLQENVENRGAHEDLHQVFTGSQPPQSSSESSDDDPDDDPTYEPENANEEMTSSSLRTGWSSKSGVPQVEGSDSSLKRQLQSHTNRHLPTTLLHSRQPSNKIDKSIEKQPSNKRRKHRRSTSSPQLRDSGAKQGEKTRSHVSLHELITPSPMPSQQPALPETSEQHARNSDSRTQQSRPGVTYNSPTLDILMDGSEWRYHQSQRTMAPVTSNAQAQIRSTESQDLQMNLGASSPTRHLAPSMRDGQTQPSRISQWGIRPTRTPTQTSQNTATSEVNWMSTALPQGLSSPVSNWRWLEQPSQQGGGGRVSEQSPKLQGPNSYSSLQSYNAPSHSSYQNYQSSANYQNRYRGQIQSQNQGANFAMSPTYGQSHPSPRYLWGQQAWEEDYTGSMSIQSAGQSAEDYRQMKRDSLAARREASARSLQVFAQTQPLQTQPLKNKISTHTASTAPLPAVVSQSSDFRNKAPAGSYVYSKSRNHSQHIYSGPYEGWSSPNIAEGATGGAIPTQMYIPGNINTEVRPTVAGRPPGGLYWGLILDDYDDQDNNEGETTLPIQLYEPPLSGCIPAYPQALEADQQPRTRKKSKYTAEQDRLILELKNRGQTWAEIAKQANCDNNLAARNRYQVLIGQQGGGTFFWTEEDVRELQSLLDEGERAKWHHIAQEMSKRMTYTVTMEMCHYKISKMFAENPEQFNVFRTLDPNRGGAPYCRSST